MKALAILCCIVWCSFSAYGQVLKGKVFGSDSVSREILPGAILTWAGTSTSVSSNENGVFEIPMEGIKDKRLIAFYLGYQTDTIAVGEKTYISITLKAMPAQIATFTVEAEKRNAYISNDAIKTEVITQKELTKAACCDLSGCFETQATVQPQTTNVITNSKELRILGLAGVYTQVLFDGIPMIQGLSYTYGVSSYPGSIVENIFVAKGANSVLQGFESISGQININSRDPEKTDTIFANFYINSFREHHYNLNYATAVGKKKKWHMLSALHMVQPATRTDRDKDNFLDLPLLTRYAVFNKWKYGNERKNGVFSTIGLRFLNEQRIGGQVNFDPGREKGSFTVYGQTVNYNQPEFYTKTGYRFSGKHALVLMGSGIYHKQSSYFGSLNYEAKQLNGYLNVQHEMYWGNAHQLKYGLSFRYQDLEERISFTDTFLLRTFAGNYVTQLSAPGIFAENVFSWDDDRITLITGARLDRHQQFGDYFTPRFLFRYMFDKSHTIRTSAGMGWRQVNLFSENINLLASSRDVIFEEQIRPEQAWNWGINYVWRFKEESLEGTLSADFYQTYFLNQFFPDYDRDPTKAFIRNFTGESMSNAFQTELNVRFFSVLEVKAAYNFLDVYRIVNEQKNVLPFNPRNRVMGAFSYRPKSIRWYFDMNMHWYDRQRLPKSLTASDYSQPYALYNVQVTHKTGRFEIYAGCENIFNFRQWQPIVGWENPFSKSFDTSSIWGPTRGREIYFGFRWKM